MDQKETKVTFFKHEAVGAKQTDTMMKRIGFSDSDRKRVVSLVKNHQFRFYEESSRKTVKKWAQSLGRQGLIDIMNVRRADRAGNLKNKNKPIDTSQMKELIALCDEMIQSGELVFLEDLKVQLEDLQNLSVDPKKYSEILKNMLGMVTVDINKNNREILLNFVNKNYLHKKDCNEH